MIKLSKWAKNNGYSYLGAYKLFRAGNLPNAKQLDSGTILVDDVQNIGKQVYVVLYSRVSSSQNKDNLNSQAERLTQFAIANGWCIDEDVREIGSGLNENRPKLLKILEESKATKIVVENKDRLCRFGYSYIECCCKKFNCEIVIVNKVTSDKEDLIQDFISVITSFCTRIYGQRRSKRKTEELIKRIHDEVESIQV